MNYGNLKELNQDLLEKGSLMALDVGTKTIGVAMSDSRWLISSPKITIFRKGGKRDFGVIRDFMMDNNIVAIVIGLPLNMDGSESKMSEFVRRFSKGLDSFLSGVKIVFFDERLSSFEAEEIMRKSGVKNNKRKNMIDKIAASVILSDALADFFQN